MSKRVLILENEPRIMRLLSLIMKLAGYEVSATRDADEAMDVLQKEYADVLLLELHMHPAGGFEVLSRLRAFSRVPVVVLTTMKEHAERALDEGADAYVTEPFVPSDLVRMVGRTLGEGMAGN